MHADLQLLIHLQELDTAADKARRLIADVPAQQTALEARIESATGVVTDVKERIATAQAARRDIEKDLAAVESRLSKFKNQLMEVKTNKEYQAMQKEMATAEHDIRAHEDRLLEGMELAESHAVELKAAEAALKAEQAEVAREQKALDAKAAEAEKELARLTEARTAVTAKLSRETLELFARIAHGRKGIAVAEARNGLCTVCHVRLRPQIYNDVRRNDGLYQCESCTRILYYVTLSSPSQTA
ncbi:C4-type zinc ribbon domain-containing protein [soil metagenome]